MELIVALITFRIRVDDGLGLKLRKKEQRKMYSNPTTNILCLDVTLNGLYTNIWHTVLL